MKAELKRLVCENPYTHQRFYYYAPIIEVCIIGNHKVGKAIRSYIDTGAAINIFPWEYGIVYLRFTDITMMKGIKFPILGVGGAQIEGYGHKCTIHHPEFSINNTYIYFVKNQPYPLLGQIGFIDQFKRVIFDCEEKTVELLK